MSDLETLAREWLDSGSTVLLNETIRQRWVETNLPSLAALLRSRDERALRIVEEVRKEYSDEGARGEEIAACDEFKRRIEADDE